MAYEYESTINSFINESLDDSDVKTEIEQENKEVYRKAKAFDEILNILKDTHSSAYDDLEDIQIIINEYMEANDEK